MARKDVLMMDYDTSDETAVAEMKEVLQSIAQLKDDKERLENKLKFQAGSNYGTRGATSWHSEYSDLYFSQSIPR